MGTESPKYDIVGLSNKIDWEGGIIDAFQYGIYSTDIADATLAALWEQAYLIYNELDPLLRKIEDYIDDHYED